LGVLLSCKLDSPRFFPRVLVQSLGRKLGLLL
jgi:hypothetical protein